MQAPFSTYSQAGQDYGYSLFWTLLLMLPVLYVNQEMVIRLGAVTGVGHARLILERFGKFWGAFSVIDLFLLNALTTVSEFIGINLGLQYLGVPKIAGVLVAACVIIGAASTGDFRRFERFAMCLIFFSFLLVPFFVLVHPPLGSVANGFFVPQMPNVPSGGLAAVLLLVIGIIGTTLAPWQLFFQQSYVIDKRITPRFIQYSRVDLGIGFIIVIGGAVALMAGAAAVFAHHPEFGNFTDDLGVAEGIAEICRPPSRRALRAGADRCQHHRRLGGFTLLSLRHRRCFQVQAFSASQAGRCETVLRCLCWPAVRCGRAGAHTGHAAWSYYERGAGACRRAAAECDSVPAPALQ